jgi:SAM-dependent methyltransferase
MSDFRTVLYDHYVSKFKGRDSQFGEDSRASYFAWCRYKLLPLLEGFKREGIILELGCGPGYMLELLRTDGFTRVKGIDISKEQAELATSRGCDAEVADVFKYLNGKDEIFDAIIALDFIEHFHRDELMILTALIFRSLKKGGRLVLQTPNGEGLFPRQVIYGDLTHLTIFTPSSLRQILEQVGFQGFYFSETGPAPKNTAGRLRLVSWSVVKSIANIIRRIETGKSQAIWTENMICCCEKPISDLHSV